MTRKSPSNMCLLSSIFLLWMSGFLPVQAQDFSSFVVEEIRLEGLDRITPGTVFNYLPVRTGDLLNQAKAGRAIRALFDTGLFRDVRLSREGNLLIVQLEERPSIASITFTGNDSVKTEELTTALKGINFAVGRVFNRSLLEQVELELQRQYFSLSKYAARIESTVVPRDRNQVDIRIEVSEGGAAKIEQINILGNQAFDDSSLRGVMSLKTGGWFSWFLKDDQYSRQKLQGDVEAISAYYQDRGYINFRVDSTQVSISPDKKAIYITLNLNEGERYTVSEVKLVGDLIVEEADLINKVTVQPGSIFSRKEVTASVEGISNRIGEEGYAFPNINPLPEINEEDKTVALTFFVDPGRRIYVRRINFRGNTKTRDEVLRREMRQMESAWMSTKHVKRSLERLELLDYFESVNVETPLVSDANDQVDVNYTVIEKPSGNLLAGLGFSQTQGLLLNVSVSQDNFLGSGKRIGVGFNNSNVNTVYSFSYLDPYTTIDGVSRGFSLFSRSTDAAKANLSRYTTDVYGGSLNYGLPISEFNNIRVGFDYDKTRLKSTISSAKEVIDFINNNGDTYNSYRMTLGWSRDTRNRALFASSGMSQSLSAEVALPFSDLEYYKISYRHQWLYPIITDYVLLMKGEVAYGDGYGSTNELPFFENYTAGGPRSVRGFKENTLGPLDSNRRSFGGNLKIVGNMELILPLPFVEESRNFRLSAFFDIGNVYGINEDFEAGLMRSSAGVAALWLSPLGVLSFSLAYPINKEPGDQTQAFQFSVGTSF